MWLKKVNMFQLLNEFNRLFQNEESNVSVLIPGMDRTLRKFLINFVFARHIRDVVDLRTVDFTDRAIQHDDPMYAVSLKVRSFYADNDSRQRLPRRCVHSRWWPSSPFGDPVLRDLGARPYRLAQSHV